ncbi:MAG TPA: YgiT-type zinc finger protein [Phycisphaerae bacterium]|nr:YgiT-type zinc finger protein [Phycisphaerae bacterium]
MTCLHCRGKMSRRDAPFQVDRNGYHLILDHVPAWVCEQCGEAYFEPPEVDLIQDAVRALDERTQRLAASA